MVILELIVFVYRLILRDRFLCLLLVLTGRSLGAVLIFRLMAMMLVSLIALLALLGLCLAVIIGRGLLLGNALRLGNCRGGLYKIPVLTGAFVFVRLGSGLSFLFF